MASADGEEKLFSLLQVFKEHKPLIFETIAQSTVIKIKATLQRAAPQKLYSDQQIFALYQDFNSKYALLKTQARAIGPDELLVPLLNFSDAMFGRFCAAEDEEDAACVLSLLPAQRINQILAELPPELKLKIYKGFSCLDQFNGKRITNVLLRLLGQFEKEGGRPVVDGADYLLKMLSEMEDEDADLLLEELRANPDLRRTILNHYIRISDILRLDDTQAKILFSEFEPRQIAYFILLAGEKIEKIIMHISNARRKAVIKDNLNSLRQGTGGKKDVRKTAQTAKQEILKRLNDLILANEIKLAESDVRPASFFEASAAAGLFN